VKFSLDLLKTPDAGSWPVSGEFKTVIGSTIKNQFAIEVETSSPDPLLPRRLSLLRIVEPEAWKSEGESSFARKPIGTGPYTVADWGPSSGQTRLDRYSNAWRPSTIETILIRAIPDPTARLQALLSGQIDVAAGLSIEDRNVLLSNGLSVQSEVLPQVMSIAFRTVDNEDSPIANQAVRQALNYAIDRNLIAEILQEGTTSPASQGAIPGVFGFNPNVPPYPFDPDKGKQLLESAGFGDGFSLNVLAPSSSSTTQAILLKAAQDLSRIGVKINYRTTTFSEWLRRYTSGTWDDIDAFMITWNAATYYDAARPMEYFSCLKNKPFFCSEHVASLIEMASRETSEQEREKLLFEIQAILKEIAPSIILSPMTYTFGYKSPSGKLPTLQTTIDFSAIDSNH
jgi:peptide/nickel transport system substrate-binding protein